MKALFAATASLMALAACTTAANVPPAPVDQIRAESRIKVVASPLPFEATVARLEAAIDARPLTRFASVDHAAGAARAGMDLKPMKLFIFGNPQAGTPFMQAEPLMGFDLPMRVLVIDEGAGASIVYPDIRALAESYGVSADAAPVEKVADTLAAIVSEATGRPSQ